MVLTEEEKKDRIRIYESLREHILKSQLSNSENFDKEILTLSSVFLGATLTFIKDIVPIKTAWYLWQLNLSYLFFIIVIISTIISFLVSQRALAIQLDYAEKYYLELQEEFLKKENKWGNWIKYLSYISAFFFIFGIFCVALFIILNLNHEVYNG